MLRGWFTDLSWEFRGQLAYHTCCRADVVGVGPSLGVRRDFIMTDGWLAKDIIPFGHLPHARADGSALYVSVRIGLMAVLPTEPETDAED